MINPLYPSRPQGETVATNKITPEKLLNRSGHPEKPAETKSTLTLLAVTALILGWILVAVAIFTASAPFYVLGITTVLTSAVLAILSLREEL
jgi:hypothetical protein